MPEAAEQQRVVRTPGVPEVITVTFPVEVDLTNSEYVEHWLLEALDVHPPVVIADMRLTTFCDSSGIRCLTHSSLRMAEEGTELRVVVCSPHIRRVMEILGIERVLALYPDMAAALAGVRAA